MLRSLLPQVLLLLLSSTVLSVAHLVPVRSLHPPASAALPPSSTALTPSTAPLVPRRDDYFPLTDHFTVARNVRYVLNVVSPYVDIVGFRFWYNVNGEHAEDEIWDAAAEEPPSLRPGTHLTLRNQVIAIDIPDEMWAEWGNVLVEAYVEISFARPGARGEIYLTQERLPTDDWYPAE